MANISTTSGGASVPQNNGGTVVGGGDFQKSGNLFTKNLEVKDLGKDEDSHGSKVVKKVAGTNDTDDVKGVIEAKGLGNGNFAYFPDPRTDDHNVLTIQGGDTNAGKINNTASTALTSSSAEHAGVERGKPNQVVGTTALGYPTWTYPVLPSTSRVPGLSDGNGQLGSGYLFTSTTDGAVAGADKNVYGNRTLAVPGEVTYRTGSATPTTTNLKARDSADI